MITSRGVRVGLAATGLLVVAGAGWALQNVSRVLVDGQLASTDVRVINGKTYVPVKDIAAALHLNVVASGDSINLTRSGGANQVDGLHGTIAGPEVFTGKWRFWARSIQQVDSYTAKYSSDHETFAPRNPGDTLYVVDCKIKNAQTKNQEMIMTQRQAGHTALTDDMEHSYQPLGYDAHNENGPYGGPTLLPGAAGEYAVVFSAPKGINLSSFVVTIFSQPGDNDKGTDLRITIPKQ